MAYILDPWYIGEKLTNEQLDNNFELYRHISSRNLLIQFSNFFLNLTYSMKIMCEKLKHTNGGMH